MKKTINKRISIYATFVLILLFLFSDNVNAAYTKWNDLNENAIDSIKAEYEDYSFCIYDAGNVYSSTSGFEYYSKLYSNSKFIFAYNDKSNDLKFVGFDKKLKSIDSEYIWDATGLDQMVRFSSDLRSHLVVNNTLSCNKLLFVETKGKGLSKGGSLNIYTESSFLDDYYFMDDDWHLDAIKETEVTGQESKNIRLQCSDKLSELKTVTDKYYNDIKEPINKLKDLKNSTFKAGDAVLASGYLQSLTETMNQTITDLNGLNLTTASDGKGFYVGNCTGNASLNTEYIRINNSLSEIKKTIDDWTTILETNLKNIDPNGADSTYAKDHEAIDSMKNTSKELDSNLKKYLDKVETGREITDATCEGLLGPNLLNDISTVLTWVRIAVPIIVIVLGSLDFVRAVISDDQQELKKATGRFTKRCIVAVAIFFVPSIIMYLLSFIDKIYDVSCDIRLW